MQKNLIYDVGMNNGDDTAYYLSKGFNVVAIEADPILCQKAATRFQKEIATKQLTILNLGVGAVTGKMPFWICEKKSAWNSFDRKIASRNGASHHSIEVKVETFSSILTQYGIPYYLKIDIEGNDKFCLDGLSANARPNYISLEDNGCLENITTLNHLGYSKFKLISQYNFLPIELPPPQEIASFQKKVERLLSHQFLSKPIRKVIRMKMFMKFNPVFKKLNRFFPDESSGPFGEDTCGRWLNFEELIDTYHYFQQQFAKRVPSLFWTEKDHSFWFDIHAKIS